MNHRAVKYSTKLGWEKAIRPAGLRVSDAAICFYYATVLRYARAQDCFFSRDLVDAREVSRKAGAGPGQVVEYAGPRRTFHVEVVSVRAV